MGTKVTYFSLFNLFKNKNEIFKKDFKKIRPHLALAYNDINYSTERHILVPSLTDGRGIYGI